MEYLVGNHDLAEKHFNEVLNKAKNPLDKAKIYGIQIPLNTVKNEMELAMTQGRKALALLGIRLPKKGNPLFVVRELIKTNRLLGKREIESLVDLPELTDLKKITITKLLMQMTVPAYISFPDYLPILILKLLNYALKNGNSVYSVYAYVSYSVILSSFLGKIENGYRFGELALKLVEKYDAKIVKCKALFIFGNLVRHWKKPMRENMRFLEEGYKAGFESGDLPFASYCINHNMSHSIFSGENLEVAKEKGVLYYDTIKKFKQIDAVYAFLLFYQFAVNLSGMNQDKTGIKGQFFNEKVTIPEWIEIKNWTDMGFYTVCMLFINYLYGDYKACLRYAEEGTKYLSSMMGMIYVKEYYYYYSLALLAELDRVNKNDRKKYLKIIHGNYQKLKKWADLAPENCLHKCLFIEAELSAHFGTFQNTASLYDQAIETAQKNGYINEVAIILEHAALFFQSLGRDRIAIAYLKEAYSAYQNWGANNKLQDLYEKYPNLFAKFVSDNKNILEQTTGMNSISDSMTSLRSVTSLDSSSSIHSTGRGMEVLDLATVMKSAAGADR